MKYIFIPTLEHIAHMKLVTMLWNQQDIRDLLEEFSNTKAFLQVDYNHRLPLHVLFQPECQSGEKEGKWQMIEAKVCEKIPQQTPQTLNDKLTGYVKPVGLQVLRWLEYHQKCFCLNLKLPKEFCWTPQGIIDKKKTAEVLIKDDNIDIITRYRLACIYCLEDDVFELRNKIPENFKVINDNTEDPREVSKMVLLEFWALFKKGSVHWENKICRRKPYEQLWISNIKALKSASVMANKAATEYFLPKLRQREEYLVEVTLSVFDMYWAEDPTIFDPPKEYYAEVLFFLLSQMNDSQQLRVFQSWECQILLPLLDWPWQHFFIKTTTQLCTLIPEDMEILQAVAHWFVCKVKLGYKEYEYRKMYGELWQQLPNDYKSRFINDSGLTGVICLLLEIKGRENIKLMFQHASLTERNKLIFSETAFIICRELALKEEWDLIKFFVQLCITSKNGMIEFKEKVMKYVRRKDLKEKWDKFSQLFHDLVCEFDKRKSIDESECSIDKKLCNNDSACKENI